jgi:hypothetical protein
VADKPSEQDVGWQQWQGRACAARGACGSGGNEVELVLCGSSRREEKEEWGLCVCLTEVRRRAQLWTCAA